MKIKRAFWASLALVPATIVPLSTATSCSQAWGFKTPLSIGSSIKGSKLNPFYNWTSDPETGSELVDLNKEKILPYLQSNYAVNVRTNGMYGYSLPQKWNENKDPEVESAIKWEKGGFEDGSAGWYDYSSSDFVKSATRKGTRVVDDASIAETLYSYRNNTLSSTIQMVGLIGTSISSLMNYALQYQGTQIGTEYASATETETNLATSWGGTINHGSNGSEANKQFFEGVFAANAVSGTTKAKAALHPTHVEFNFSDAMFPIVAYKAANDKITGVNELTLKLLNNEAVRPGSATKKYWSSVTDEQTEKITDVRTKAENTYKYKVYTYTNVPVVVRFNSLTRSYVDQTKNDSFLVSEYYADTKEIDSAIGDSWKESLPKFATGSTGPTYSAFSYSTTQDPKLIEYSSSQKFDERLYQNVYQNSFIVLLNYAYKEYTSAPTGVDPASLDRVTMTGLNTVFPAYFLDKSVELGESTFFETANKNTDTGYVIDSSKVNKYSDLLLELLKRSAGQGLITEANKLNDTSKQLLKLLRFMFGDKNLNVETKNIITTYDLK